MTFQDLQQLVIKCTTTASPFYRNLYGLPDNTPLHIATWDEWRALPIFSKEHLCKETLLSRAFPPRRNIDSILASSGTSGNPPVFSPFVINDGYEYRLQYHDFARATLSSMPTLAQQEWILRRHRGGTYVLLDPRRHQASLRLAKAAGVDSMLLILHHVPLIMEDMKRLSMHTDIRFIEIAGETPSQSLFASMRETFPHATITSIYGSSDVETSPIAIPCHPIRDEDPRAVYHTGTRTFLEVVDKETGEPIMLHDGVEGDLLVTADGGPHATFPLIRYKIGDTVRIVKTRCEEHGDWSFEVVGRSDMDFLKVPGGILRADEVERALREIGLPDRFELHRYERHTPRGLKTEVIVHVLAPDTILLKTLAERLARVLRVSANYTYEHGVTEGLYLPLICERLPEGPKLGKTKRMISHT